MTLTAVVIQDLRTRLRSGLTYVLLTVLVTLYGALVLAAYWLMTSQPSLPVPSIGTTQSPANAPFDALTRAIVAHRGATLLLGMGLLQGLLLAVLCPAIASSAITSERERQTFDLLATAASPGTIMIGKVLSNFAYVALLTLALAPTLGLVVLFGTLAGLDVVAVLAVLLGAAGVSVAIGVFCSSWASSSVLATFLTYCASILLFTGGTAALVLKATVATGSAALQFVSYLSPIAALLAVVDRGEGRLAGLLPGPMTAALANADRLGWLPGKTQPFWVTTLGLYLVLALLLIAAGAWALDPVRARVGLARLVRRPRRQSEPALAEEEEAS